MTTLQERTKVKGACRNGGGRIGHEGHHKGVIWHDNDEIIILKIERNDKYYTF